MTNDLTVLAPVSLTDHLGIWENAKNKGASAYTLDAIPFASIEDVKAFADKAKQAKQAKADASEASARAQGNAYAALVGLATSAAGRSEVMRLASVPVTTKQGKIQGQGVVGALRELGLEGHAPTWANLMSARSAGLALTKEGKTLAKTALEQALKAYNTAIADKQEEQARLALAAADARDEEEAFRLNGTPTSAMVAEAEQAKAALAAKENHFQQVLEMLKAKDDAALPFMPQLLAVLADMDKATVQAAGKKAKAESKKEATI